MPLPIAAVQAVTPTSYLSPSAAAAPSTSGTDFGSALTDAVNTMQTQQAESDTLAVKAVTGDLTDIHRATLAATRAQVTLEVFAAVRNKGVDAFNEIMRMQA
jgi:flagellar hook-basal body complex protein FliE